MALIKCRVCGATNKKEAKFCENCGIKISKNKRKILSIIVLVLIIIGAIILRVYLVNEKRNDNNQEKENTDKIIKLDFVTTLVGLEKEDVILTDLKYVITSDNIYTVTFKKLYSNDTNYKNLEFTKKVLGIQLFEDLNYGYQFLDNEKNIYFASKPEDLQNAVASDTVDYDYTLVNNELYTNNNQVFFADFNGMWEDTTYENGILVENNDIPSNEKVLAIYKSGNKYYLKTDKAFYKFNEKKVATNKEECEKYVDVLCIYEYVYEIVKEDYLTKHYKDIKYPTNGYLILQNNKVYFYS